MNAREARACVYTLLSAFFAGATVVYANQSNMVKATGPLVTLTTLSTTRPLYPPERIVDGEPQSYYPTTMKLQIDLYTQGAEVNAEYGMSIPMENTAVSDLLQFGNFIGSEYVVNWCHRKDISLTPANDVTDNSGLINTASYQYRATLELSVAFTETAAGYTGIAIPDDGSGSEFEPSSSGGGTKELAESEIGYFTSAEIEAIEADNTKEDEN